MSSLLRGLSRGLTGTTTRPSPLVPLGTSPPTPPETPQAPKSLIEQNLEYLPFTVIMAIITFVIVGVVAFVTLFQHPPCFLANTGNPRRADTHCIPCEFDSITAGRAALVAAFLALLVMLEQVALDLVIFPVGTIATYFAAIIAIIIALILWIQQPCSFQDMGTGTPDCRCGFPDNRNGISPWFLFGFSFSVSAIPIYLFAIFITIWLIAYE